MGTMVKEHEIQYTSDKLSINNHLKICGLDWNTLCWTSIASKNHCIAPIKCNGMEALLCISMMIPELSQNGCDVLCKARSYITVLLTKTMVVEASKPLSEYLPVQIWQLESHQKGWNVKSASFLPHDPFIGGSIGHKGAPPPHRTFTFFDFMQFSGNFWQSCMLYVKLQALKW